MLFPVVALAAFNLALADDVATATATETADATVTTDTTSLTQSATLIWATGTINGVLTTYQTIWSQTFRSTFTSATIMDESQSTSSYDLTSARASRSSFLSSESTKNGAAMLGGAGGLGLMGLAAALI